MQPFVYEEIYAHVPSHKGLAARCPGVERALHAVDTRTATWSHVRGKQFEQVTGGVRFVLLESVQERFVDVTLGICWHVELTVRGLFAPCSSLCTCAAPSAVKAASHSMWQHCLRQELGGSPNKDRSLVWLSEETKKWKPPGGVPYFEKHPFLVQVPFFDFANHSAYPNARWTMESDRVLRQVYGNSWRRGTDIC